MHNSKEYKSVLLRWFTIIWSIWNELNTKTQRLQQSHWTQGHLSAEYGKPISTPVYTDFTTAYRHDNPLLCFHLNWQASNHPCMRHLGLGGKNEDYKPLQFAFNGIMVALKSLNLRRNLAVRINLLWWDDGALCLIAHFQERLLLCHSCYDVESTLYIS